MKDILLLCALSILLIFGNADTEDDTQENQSQTHPYGHPLNLMRFDDNETISIDFDALEATFLHPEVKDRKIVAISIIGAFRKGKSFLMDYALRFMYANYKSVSYQDNPLNHKKQWVGDEDAPLKGFSWRGGAARDTTGVVLWSDVFLHEQINQKTRKNEKLAIILLDTQGLFDQNTSPTDNSRIFALGTLISSVQIFNLNDVILENQLEYLQMATDFAKFALKKNKQGNRNLRPYKPFQTLIFLMRDWQNSEDFDYGHSGGSNYLQTVLNIDPAQPKVLQDVRRYITETFEQRLCFLLPHPGSNVANNKQYDGRFSLLSEDFQIQLKDFLNWLLEPKNLKVKKILNNEVTGAEYIHFIKLYFEAFQYDELPKIETLHGLTVKKQYDFIISEAMDAYKNSFQALEFKVNGTLKELNVLEQEMDQMCGRGLEAALKFYKEKKKLGGTAEEKKYEAELKNLVATSYTDWKFTQFESYKTLKKIEEDNQRKLENLAKTKAAELERERLQAEEERQRLENEHRETTRVLKDNITEEQNKRAQEIENLRQQNERERQKAEEERLKMLKQLEIEKEAIQNKAAETENAFKMELEKMQQAIKRREEEAQRKIEAKQAEGLERLKIEAEERREQFKQEMLIAEKRAKAVADQRAFEREQLLEERRIREEARKEERREREKAEREQKEADRKFHEQMIEARRQAEKEEREAKAERDRQWMLMMQEMNKKPEAAPERKGFNLWSCIGSLFTNC